MGQNTSSARQNPGLDRSGAFSQPTQRYEELGDGVALGREILANEADREVRNTVPPASASNSRGTSMTGRNPGYRSTYRRETRARSTLISGDVADEEADNHGRDDVVLEQEERPLILRDMEVRLNDAPITDIQAAPMPRRASVLSRLGSRVIRRNSLWPREMERAAEEEGLTNRPATSDLAASLSLRPSTVSTRNNRFSMFDLPTHAPTSPRHNLRSSRSSFSNAIRSTEYSTDPEALNPQEPANISSNPPETQTDIGSEPAHSPPNQRARHFRRSLLGPISNILHSSRTRPQRDRPSSRRERQTAEETANLISPQGTGTDASMSETPVRNIRFGTEEGSEANPAELESPERPTSWFSSSRNSADRPASEGRRGGRRMQHLLGGRSSRLMRREDDTPLSRVLQLAAAAIAAQLSGSTDSSPDLQSVGDDHFDGNLNAFIQSLNTAAEASVNADEDSNMNSLPPLNFWRVFRFVNSTSRDSRSGLNQNPPGQVDGNGSRLVTLVVVGVRSVPSSTLLSDTPGTLNTNLDGILALPSTPTEALNLGIGMGSDRSTRNRLTRRRRTSFTGANSNSNLLESQRHENLAGGRLNRATARNPLRRSPGSSMENTPVRSPSPFPDGGRLARHADSAESSPGLASAPSTSSSRESPSVDAAAPSSRSSEPSVSSIRQRPRSESHGHLGSGAARRNGVVEPDGNGRHWLIYVVGTNLAEDHPAFQAPSLFTDNPSYEDMLMLSALLGPVKPPVASAQDVAIADGVYRLELRRTDGLWMARTLDRPDGSDGVASPLVTMSREVENCLVCLTDYESGEEIRQLRQCAHVFHRECIDTVATPVPSAAAKASMRKQKQQRRERQVRA